MLVPAVQERVGESATFVAEFKGAVRVGQLGVSDTKLLHLQSIRVFVVPFKQLYRLNKTVTVPVNVAVHVISDCAPQASSL